MPFRAELDSFPEGVHHQLIGMFLTYKCGHQVETGTGGSGVDRGQTSEEGVSGGCAKEATMGKTEKKMD